MAKIFNDSNVKYFRKEREVTDYCWSSISDVNERVKSKNIEVQYKDIRAREVFVPLSFS